MGKRRSSRVNGLSQLRCSGSGAEQSAGGDIDLSHHRWSKGDRAAFARLAHETGKCLQCCERPWNGGDADFHMGIPTAVQLGAFCHSPGETFFRGSEFCVLRKTRPEGWGNRSGGGGRGGAREDRVKGTLAR